VLLHTFLDVVLLIGGAISIEEKICRYFVVTIDIRVSDTRVQWLSPGEEIRRLDWPCKSISSLK